MQIRDFKQGDLELYMSYSRDFYSSDAVLHQVPDENFENTFNECIKKNPYTRGLLLRDGDVGVGYALLSFIWSTEAGGLVVLLDEFYITPESRGKGYGTKFLDWLMEEYSAASGVRLEVSSDNDGATRLYERRGFKYLEYRQMVKPM